MVITGVLSQKIPVDVGRCVLYGVGIQKSLIEAGEIERRLGELEERLAQQQPLRAAGWGR